MGAGVLSLPFAFRAAGWAGCLIATLVVAAIETFTLYVLARYAEATGSATYSQLVRKMLGRKASLAMSIVLIIYSYGSGARSCRRAGQRWLRGAGRRVPLGGRRTCTLGVPEQARVVLRGHFRTLCPWHPSLPCPSPQPPPTSSSWATASSRWWQRRLGRCGGTLPRGGATRTALLLPCG